MEFMHICGTASPRLASALFKSYAVSHGLVGIRKYVIPVRAGSPLVVTFTVKLSYCRNSVHNEWCIFSLVMATFHPVETNAGTTTTWIPITTELPLVPACSAAIYSQQGDQGKLIAFDPFYYTIDTTFTTACIPPEATEWWNQPINSSIVSSLGPITCPEAYTTAFNISASSGSTRVGCCPS